METKFKNYYYLNETDCILFLQKTWHRKLRPVWWIVSLLLLVAGVLLAASGRLSHPLCSASLLGGMAILIYWEFFAVKAKAREFMANAQKCAGTPHPEVEIQIDENEITMTMNLFVQKISYTDIKALLDLGDYLILMTHTGPFTYSGIPVCRNGFENSTISQFYTFLTEKRKNLRWFS